MGELHKYALGRIFLGYLTDESIEPFLDGWRSSVFAYITRDMEQKNRSLIHSLFDGGESDLNQLTEKVIGCAFTVSNVLGCGYLEKVYENALAHEIRKAGFKVVQQFEIKVHYDGTEVGRYTADLFVEDCLIIELKAARALEDAHLAQCLNYLKATGLRLALLINFGRPRIEVRRVAR